MLKQLSRAAVAAAVLALAPLSTAKALVCTSGSLVFCFDFTFGTNSASVTYQSGTGTLTGFGIDGYTFYNSISVGSSAGSFSLTNNNVCSLGGFTADQCATSNNGITGGFPPVGSVTFQFSGNATAPSSPLGIVHIQNANNLTGCSLWINSAGTIVSGANNAECQTTTTPEPASGALIATGLLGLGGGLIRRRRKSS
ncbi:MAG TPA: PEP-CTERM sorting domain-containing protein [Gemmatimonadaceae bacterium]|jgi:MYXO-CTERM domain-containing protein|nr:PEP-CTERM sorting domain-containing protein [Gemmatimonadaceae bacterium]